MIFNCVFFFFFFFGSGFFHGFFLNVCDGFAQVLGRVGWRSRSGHADGGHTGGKSEYKGGNEFVHVFS